LLAQSADLLAALNRARGNEAQQLAERWQKVQEDLEQVWGQLETLAPEYVALRRGRPVSYGEIQGCLAA